MSIEELFAKNQKALNENDHHIWKYISLHRKECEAISINELAHKCNVSRSTILRFTKRLGLKGFAEFKVLLKIDNTDIATKSNNLEFFYHSYANYMEYLIKHDFSMIIEKIQSSKEIYACGTGSIQGNVTSELKRSLTNLGKFLYQIRLFDEIYLYEDIITPGDVVFLISYSGNNEKIVEFAKKIKAKGAFTIAITSSNSNQLNQICDENIYVSVPRISNPLGSPYEGLVNYFILIDFMIVKYLEKVQES